MSASDNRAADSTSVSSTVCKSNRRLDRQGSRAVAGDEILADRRQLGHPHQLIEECRHGAERIDGEIIRRPHSRRGDQIIFGRVALFVIQALVNEAGNDMNFETRDEDVAWIRKLSP